MKDNNLLVVGYIKQIQKELKIQVPVVLHALINQYCPHQTADQITQNKSLVKSTSSEKRSFSIKYFCENCGRGYKFNGSRKKHQKACHN
eukprot:UN10291